MWPAGSPTTRARLSRYLASPNGTNEELYLAQKFARVAMSSNNVDVTSNLQPEATLALERGLGYGAATNPIWDLAKANCILVFNSNLTEDNNVVGLPIKSAAKEGASLVVIDAREVELTRHADLWLRPAPGSESLLLGGILKEILEQGLDQKDWVEEHCEDPATLLYYLNNLDLAEVAAATQVPSERITEAARLYGQADRAAICFALDNVSEDIQRHCASALVDLALLTGNVGQRGAGLYPIRQGANEQGAWDVGCIANRLPGRGPAYNDRARAELEEILQCTLPEGRGLSVAQSLEAVKDGRIKAMLLIGDTPDVVMPEFLVVLDTFLTPAAEGADVVLPRATFAEKDGTYTNLERRIQRVRPGFQPKRGDARSDLWVLEQLARRLGADGFDNSSPAAVMEEIALVAPTYSGVTYSRLENAGSLVFSTGLDSPKPTQMLYSGRSDRGIQWPSSDEKARGTQVLYEESFPIEKAVLVAPEFRTAEVAADPEYPAWLAPGRVLLQRDRETSVELEQATKLNKIVRDEIIEVNTHDAAAWSIAEGDEVRVETADHHVRGIAQLNPTLPAGLVSVTGLFGQLAVDLENSQENDAMARTPGLHVAPARVVKV